MGSVWTGEAFYLGEGEGVEVCFFHSLAYLLFFLKYSRESFMPLSRASK
jgi:hypothetical protein